MAMNTGDHDNMMSEINVTPLVDVMLVLLTIFIVTAPLLTNAVPVNLPKETSNNSLTQKDSVSISVTENGLFYFEGVDVSEAELEMQLIDIAGNPDTIVEIFADEKVEYGTIARVMAAIQRSGIRNFTFVMKPDIELAE